MTNAAPQFDIASHYDVMAQLDRDVHENNALSASEVELTLRLIKNHANSLPQSVFLPCFGTGRHIPHLLRAGVKHIVGVDLSAACVAKARALIGNDERVSLEVGDLTVFDPSGPGYPFDATILLGNSFGDCIDPDLLQRLTQAMLDPLKSDGIFVMDYIGQWYLDRCRSGATSTWQAVLNNTGVLDHRTPRFDPESGIMTIDIEVSREDDPAIRLWNGSYQKRILGRTELSEHFSQAGFVLKTESLAIFLSPYALEHKNELGMIAASEWWTARSKAYVREEGWRHEERSSLISCH